MPPMSGNFAVEQGDNLSMGRKLTRDSGRAAFADQERRARRSELLSQIKVRPARSEDAEGIAALHRRECFADRRPGTGGLIAPLGVEELRCRMHTADFFVAEGPEQEVLGCLQVSPELPEHLLTGQSRTQASLRAGGPVRYASGMVVEPRRGIGPILLGGALEHVGDQPLMGHVWSGNFTSRQLLESHGFREIGWAEFPEVRVDGCRGSEYPYWAMVMLRPPSQGPKPRDLSEPESSDASSAAGASASPRSGA